MRLRVSIDANLCTGCLYCVETCPEVFVVGASGLSHLKKGSKIAYSAEEVAIDNKYLPQVNEAARECPGEIIMLRVPDFAEYETEFSLLLSEAEASSPAKWALEACYGLTPHKVIKQLSPSQYCTLGVCITASKRFYEDTERDSMFDLKDFLYTRSLPLRKQSSTDLWSEMTIEKLRWYNDRVSYLIELVQIGVVQCLHGANEEGLLQLSEYGRLCADAYQLYYKTEQTK